MNRRLSQEFIWNFKSARFLKISKVHVRVTVMLLLFCYCAPPPRLLFGWLRVHESWSQHPLWLNDFYGVSISFWNRNNMLVAVRETCQRCLTEVLIKQNGVGPRVKPRVLCVLVKCTLCWATLPALQTSLVTALSHSFLVLFQYYSKVVLYFMWQPYVVEHTFNTSKKEAVELCEWVSDQQGCTVRPISKNLKKFSYDYIISYK